MAIQKVIRGEEGGAFSRWELPQVGQPAPRQPEAAPTREPEPEPAIVPAAPSVAELEALQKQAYDEGFAAGRKEGYDAGHKEGLEAGHKEGFEAGHKDGLEAGHKDGLANAQKEGRELAARLKRALDTLAQPMRELDEAVEQQLTHMTLLLASQVIRRELHTQPGEIVACVREALALLPLSARDVKVHMHPDDARFIRESMGEGEEPAWKMVEDPGVSRGGCRVVTSSSYIDATLERRLAALASDLLGGDRADDNGAAE